MEIKISRIAEMVAINSFLNDQVYTTNELKEAVNYIFENIDIIGEDNIHLRNSLNLDETVYYFRPREKPLLGQEIVIGDYLLFDYTGHNEEMYLRQYNSLNEIEEQITNSGGITNPFTTFQVSIINGAVQKYEIYFTDKNDGIEYKFIKNKHDALPEYQSIFSKSKKPHRREYDISNVRIVWKE